MPSEDDRGRTDPLRLSNAEAVLGPGFQLRLGSSGGMLARSWTNADEGMRLPPATKGENRYVRTWATDLSPLRTLYPEEIPGLRVESGHAIDDDEMDHIAALPWLEVLDIQGTAVTSLGVAKLAGFDRLWSLNLSATLISDQAVETVATLSALEELSLADTAVTDACVPNLLRLENLLLLNLERTNIGPASTRALVELPNLRVLNVPGKVSLRTEWWVRRHRPHLWIG